MENTFCNNSSLVPETNDDGQIIGEGVQFMYSENLRAKNGGSVAFNANQPIAEGDIILFYDYDKKGFCIARKVAKVHYSKDVTDRYSHIYRSATVFYTMLEFEND